MGNLNKVPQIIVRITFIIGIVLSAIMILSFLFNRNKIPGVFKNKPVVIETNSSISSVKKGDLVIIKDIEKNEYKKGNIVVFRGDKKKNIISKIDNINDDSFILSRNIKIDKDLIQGIKTFKIPLLGYLIMFLQSIIGFIVTIILLLVSFIWYKSKLKYYKNV